MKSDNDIVPIEVFAGTAWQAELLKSLLENDEVESYLNDQIMGTLNPWYTAPGGAGSVSVFVSNQDFAKAKLIVDEFEKNLREPS